MTIEKTKIGIIGCGNISGIYLQVCPTFEILEIAACTDIDLDKAKQKADEFGISKVCTVEELLADPEITIVLNLTIPKVHAEIALAAIEAGKSVYNEKPLAVTREDGKRILESAKKKDVLVGSAPDTFLGGGIQTCRKLIDEGAIGEPIGATAFMMCHGHERWHPNPEFFYKPGGGPMFDMGPYYLTALINLIGPVKRVTGSARTTFPERTITSEPFNGTVIKVETPTHLAGIMDFANGAVGTIITSFDVWAHTLPNIEVHGTEGSMSVPNPNIFGGPVRIKRSEDEEWKEVDLTHGYEDNTRGLGVADMAYALRSGRPHRASGELAYHVLDIMHAFLDASDQGRHIEIESTCRKPAPLPTGLEQGKVDE